MKGWVATGLAVVAILAWEVLTLPATTDKTKEEENEVEDEYEYYEDNEVDVDDGRDPEEIACGVEGGAAIRNGLGDNSMFLWPDNRVPYTVDDSFNATEKGNIAEAVEEYNRLFDGCIKWVPRQSEVKKTRQISHWIS